MSNITPERLSKLLMEAYINQINQFRKDLELRIAAVLKVNTDLPASAGIAMSVGVSNDIADYLDASTIHGVDNIIKKAL